MPCGHLVRRRRGCPGAVCRAPGGVLRRLKHDGDRGAVHRRELLRRGHCRAGVVRVCSGVLVRARCGGGPPMHALRSWSGVPWWRRPQQPVRRGPRILLPSHDRQSRGFPVPNRRILCRSRSAGGGLWRRRVLVPSAVGGARGAGECVHPGDLRHERRCERLYDGLMCRAVRAGGWYVVLRCVRIAVVFE